MKILNLRCMMVMLPILTYAQIDLNYQVPHNNILELADVPLPPSISINSEGTKALLIYREQYQRIEDLSEDELRLAGLRINPKINISSRARFYTNLALFNPISTKESVILNLPLRPKIANVSWSPSQNYIAFTNTTDVGNELWYIDYNKKSAHQLTSAILNANMGIPFVWLADESGFLVKTLPKNRPSLINTTTKIPTGPKVSVNEAGVEAQNRTYQDLLKNKDDESNFTTLATSEIKEVSLKGKITPWKDAGMYRSMSFSPDGKYLMLAEAKPPFSYIVTYGRFPTTYTIYDRKATVAYVVANIPLIEDMPKGFMATRTGKRNFSWRADQPATLVWVEALDAGDPNKEVEFRDELFTLEAPFTKKKKSLLKTQLRYSSISWSDKNLAILYEYWWNTRTVKTSLFNPSNTTQAPRLFNERNYQNQYDDPGDFITKRNEFNRSVVLQTKDGNLLLMGDGYSAAGKNPFIDKLSLASLEVKRIYQSQETDQLESFVSLINAEEGLLLTRLESNQEFSNYYFRNIFTGNLTQISSFKNPFEAIQNVKKEVITYQREDGLELSGTLYLPVDYIEDEKYPMIMWAYPREFKDKQSASQVTSSSKEFTYPYYGSPLYWVNRGYVVLDDAAFPIIGEELKEPNDSFVEQLVGNAKAAIEAVDKMGLINRQKVAVGGHSYGAFMTANLLSHSDLFAAGIARSGAYNRTLTPFGFQSEERNYWEAPGIYNTMSPFMNAHTMKTPLLLIHGEDDNNSGTYPMQSERYFNALKGLGAPVRLVMLPKESHGYAAKESIMHMLWEQDQWLEKYVKNRGIEKCQASNHYQKS